MHVLTSLMEYESSTVALFMARKLTTGLHDPSFFFTQNIVELYQDRLTSINFRSSMTMTNSWTLS